MRRLKAKVAENHPPAAAKDIIFKLGMVTKPSVVNPDSLLKLNQNVRCVNYWYCGENNFG